VKTDLHAELRPPISGSASMLACILVAACAAASALANSTITLSPLVLTTWPPLDSAASRTRSMQRAITSSAAA